MTRSFEELDYQQTPLGDISLRRRAEPRLNGKILYEVKLGDEFLMSSLFPEAEIQLSKLALAFLKPSIESKELNIIVGGLGLGYTAVAALEDSDVKTLTVIDIMQPVIDWHEQGLVPLGQTLTDDPRCTLQHDDFFAVASANTNSFYNEQSVHAILLDIDHSPSHWLNDTNQTFYSQENLSNMANKLYPNGVFGLWSNDPPETEFTHLLESVFSTVESHIIRFANPYNGSESTNTVYLAKKSA